MERRRLVGSILPLVLACTGCGGSTVSDTGAPQLDPVELLADRPVLPRTFMTGDGARSIDWAKEPGDGGAELRTCEGGEGAFRSWSDVPRVDHAVCALPTERAARDLYASQSLLEVGGEDWPNFEPYSEVKTVPTDIDSLDVLAADEWEIGCGIGEPDSGCGVWTFRARYGRVLTEVEFTASPGAIRYKQMRDLVVSVDREVAARAPS